MIRPHTLEELDEFIVHLNGCTESIRITTDVSKTEIHFLNIKITLNGGKLQTDLYMKPEIFMIMCSTVWPTTLQRQYSLQSISESQLNL